MKQLGKRNYHVEILIDDWDQRANTLKTAIESLPKIGKKSEAEETKNKRLCNLIYKFKPRPLKMPQQAIYF